MGRRTFEVREIAELGDECRETRAGFVGLENERLLAVAERSGLLTDQHPQVAHDDGDGSPELVDGQGQKVGRFGVRAREGWHLGIQASRGAEGHR